MALQQSREEAIGAATTKDSAEIFIYSDISIFPSVGACSSFSTLHKYFIWSQSREELFFRLFYSHVIGSLSDPGYLVRPLLFLGAEACTYQGILIYEMDPHL